MPAMRCSAGATRVRSWCRASRTGPLIEAIGYGGEVQMPPKGKLKDEEIAALREWVKQGALWPAPRPAVNGRPITTTDATARSAADTVAAAGQGVTLWSLQPVQGQRPRWSRTAWPDSPVDRFILAKLEQNGLAPLPAGKQAGSAARAVRPDRAAAYPQQIDAFIRDDAPTAFASVVDRFLLASPHRRTLGTILARRGALARTRPTHSSPGCIPMGFAIVTG